MNELKKILFFLFIFSSIIGESQESIFKSVDWNGYTQLRFSSNFSDVNSFVLRRMKLWIQSAPDFDKHWGFKVQTTLTNFQNEKFVLQDVAGYYKTKQWTFHFGQFIPHYSLQRSQADYAIPMAEREASIDALIPNGTLGVRDIGIEGSWQSQNKIIESWFGIFNGNGIKDYRLNNSGILLSQKTNVYLFNRHVLAGYSIMYRKADRLQLLNIFPDFTLFSGNDFRYNIFAKVHLRSFEFQSEYLYANLDSQIADGYYFLASFKQNKNLWVVSWSKYTDLIPSTSDAPEFHLVYNYLINQDRLKVMLDNGVKINKEKLSNYSMVLQVQIFFN